MTAPPALRAEGISKRYGHVTALQGAELEVRAGEVCALIGDNGAGKSTLVKILSGAEAPDAGTVFLDGKAVTMASPSAAQDLGVSTVFQDLALASDLGPTENFYLGRELLKGRLGRLLGITDRKRMASSAREEFSRLGVNLKSMNVPVGSLSGGQRQSIAIARAAAWADKVIILDEPTAALGVVQTDRVLRLVRTVAERGLAVILVTHNMTHVVDVADSVQVLRLGRRVATFERGQSTVEKLVAAMTSDPAAAKEDGEQ